MSTPINDGGRAFPLVGYSGGMSLRDYFAAQALHGLMASGKLPEDTTFDVLAEYSYKNADAMIKAREEVTK